MRMIPELLAGLLFAGLLPAEAGNRYAENFVLEQKQSHQLLTIHNPLAGNRAEQRFALVSGEDSPPDLPTDCILLRVPLQRMLALETVPLGYLDALDSLDALAGVGSARYITNPQVKAALEEESLQAVPSGPGLDAETILLLQPDLLLTSASNDPASDLPEALRRNGPTVFATTGYLEPHPLGRAEWLRVFAALLGKSDQANQIFNAVADRYEKLAASTNSLADRPSVFCQAPFAGVWHVPGGNSHTAQLIADAGGVYLWADHPGSAGIPLDLERVFLRAAQADVWLHPGVHRSLKALLAADPRLQRFHAVQTRQVYNNTRKANPQGGNPIHEEALVRPDILLADLIHILHPDCLPEHEPVYYERLP
jgi:iron complex transport system substrate-binding protein